MIDEQLPVLIFPDETNEELEILLFDVAMKEYCLFMKVRSPEGNVYDVSFATPSRITSEIEYSNFYIERNLIIIKEITVQNMQDSIIEAYKNGFFK